ncbi:hypothetical protein [Caulobacter sp. Root342]|uniref:hypothetical protein n=1 Tax=Caulobacter sp. Root342 TaxID=1736519 RepID=UPI0006FFE901|nr:hypothetical protein [Caulobacter sp. Root342]KQV54686.1 hypothetical protein ASC62_23135 [Caulobacter sp. Root342]
MSSTEISHDVREIIADHIASGQPRYSNTFYFPGGFIRRWTDDEAVAKAQLEIDAADPNLKWTIAFDHMTVRDLGVVFPPHGKTAEQLKAECDEALDQMWARWEAAERFRHGGGR